jgi:serine/threonine protein kinase
MSRKGTYKMSDYWSFAVFLYEMLYGKLPKCRCNLEAKEKSVEWCPFGDDQQEEDNSIKEDGKIHIKIKYPHEYFTPEAEDLLKKLFVADPFQRLGAKGGIDEIKKHPFFKPIDWDRLAAFQITPPFLPSEDKVNAKDVNEVGEFHKSKFHKVKVTESDEKYYENFTFVSQESLQEEMVGALQKIDDYERRKAEERLKANGCCTLL